MEKYMLQYFSVVYKLCPPSQVSTLQLESLDTVETLYQYVVMMMSIVSA